MKCWIILKNMMKRNIIKIGVEAIVIIVIGIKEEITKKEVGAEVEVGVEAEKGEIVESIKEKKKIISIIIIMNLDLKEIIYQKKEKDGKK